ncbi:MAG: histidine kinase N-terminal 7TM domain-containing protein [Halobacteriota archaeon]
MVERLYVGVLAMACVAGFGVAYAAWTNREATGADALGATGLAVAIWAGGTIGLVLSTASTAELRWLQFSYLGIVASPIAFVLLALEYTGHKQYVTRPVLAGLGGLGAAFLLLVWTNPAHNIYWAHIEYTVAVPEGISTTPGPGFWAFVVFTYASLLVGSALFVRYAVTAPHLYRVQTAALLVAIAAPWAANIPHALQFMTADYTPIALSVTCLGLWVAMFRYRLTDVGPVALRTIFESVAPGVYVLNRHGRVIDVNAAGTELFDVAADDVVGRPFREIFSNETLPECVSAEATQEIVALESVGSTDGSDDRYVEVSVTPIRDERGREGGKAVVITDVTSSQRQQRQLEAKNERLDQFAAVVSHDLRNPLFVAQGRLELAKAECDSEHLEPVADAHERMEALIDDLLVLAREGDSVSEFELVELASVARRCWDTVDTGEGTLVVDDGVRSVILADDGRLLQLFENLMRNAVEHGGERVTVTVGELDGGFYLEDDGPGIPEDERTTVFDAGYSTNDEGTGFGLHIVAEIADAHGWGVRVDDGSDGGARFEITGVEKRDD